MNILIGLIAIILFLSICTLMGWVLNKIRVDFDSNHFVNGFITSILIIFILLALWALTFICERLGEDIKTLLNL